MRPGGFPDGFVRGDAAPPFSEHLEVGLFLFMAVFLICLLVAGVMVLVRRRTGQGAEGLGHGAVRHRSRSELKPFVVSVLVAAGVGVLPVVFDVTRLPVDDVTGYAWSYDGDGVFLGTTGNKSPRERWRLADGSEVVLSGFPAVGEERSDGSRHLRVTCGAKHVWWFGGGYRAVDCEDPAGGGSAS